MLSKLLTALALVVLATPAEAQTWLGGCQSTNSNTRSLVGRQFACFDPDANTDDSPIIDVSNCERTNWSIWCGLSGEMGGNRERRRSGESSDSKGRVSRAGTPRGNES